MGSDLPLGARRVTDMGHQLRRNPHHRLTRRDQIAFQPSSQMPAVLAGDRLTLLVIPPQHRRPPHHDDRGTTSQRRDPRRIAHDESIRQGQPHPGFHRSRTLGIRRRNYGFPTVGAAPRLNAGTFARGPASAGRHAGHYKR